jgi:hypothetical protein
MTPIKRLTLYASKMTVCFATLMSTSLYLLETSAGDNRLPKAFVYTEVQNNKPFSTFPWREANPVISANPGFLYKTWLSGVNTNSIGGVYAFDGLENARKYATEWFPERQRAAGVAHATRMFDATVTEEANRDVGSVDTGNAVRSKPAAFVYTEIQAGVPFSKFNWRERNKAIKTIPGLLSYTWLSGLYTNTIGGVYAFDSMDSARKFATDEFPKLGREMGASIYTRIFDGVVVEDAARGMKSPYFQTPTN